MPVSIAAAVAAGRKRVLVNFAWVVRRRDRGDEAPAGFVEQCRLLSLINN
jgi:hypothetical protein